MFHRGLCPTFRIGCNVSAFFTKTINISLNAILTHFEHERALDDAPSDAEHAGEEPREKADAGVPDGVEGSPFDVPFHVLVAQLRLQVPPVHEVLAHSPVHACLEACNVFK